MARRIANNVYLPELEIRKWFDDALMPGDPKPSLDTLSSLARQIQIQINRANNREAARTGTNVPLRDVSIDEWQQSFKDNIAIAAKRLDLALEDYEKNLGSHFVHPSGAISVEELRETLRLLGAWSAPLPGKPKRGRTEVPWRKAGREIALLVKQAMKDAGFRGRLSLANPESIPVRVATAAICWAYKISLKPEGFVTAMRKRNRSKRH